jgi:gamma-glutamylcyclotransferase (GGCT)/AIG2-like uncharacterized protein YtfP
MHNEKYILFVYGTLKKNERASYMLADAEYLGEGSTKPNYQLYSCGSFPAMIAGDNVVDGELYLIDKFTKNKLDFYEGVLDGYYDFKEIELSKISIIGFDKYKFLDQKIYAYTFNESIQDFQKINRWPCANNDFLYNNK